MIIAIIILIIVEGLLVLYFKQQYEKEHIKNELYQGIIEHLHEKLNKR